MNESRARGQIIILLDELVSLEEKTGLYGGGNLNISLTLTNSDGAKVSYNKKYEGKITHHTAIFEIDFSLSGNEAKIKDDEFIKGSREMVHKYILYDESGKVIKEKLQDK